MVLEASPRSSDSNSRVFFTNKLIPLQLKVANLFNLNGQLLDSKDIPVYHVSSSPTSFLFMSLVKSSVAITLKFYHMYVGRYFPLFAYGIALT